MVFILGILIIIIALLYSTYDRYTYDTDDHGEKFKPSDDYNCFKEWISEIFKYTLWGLKTGKWSHAKFRYQLLLGKCDEKIFTDVTSDELALMRSHGGEYAGYQNLNSESETYGCIIVTPATRIFGKVSPMYPSRDVKGWPFFVYIGLLDLNTGRIERRWLYDSKVRPPVGWTRELLHGRRIYV